MATNFIWWIAVAVETVILVRGAQTRLLQKYPLFYGYVGCVLAKDILELFVYRFMPDWYAPLYWPADLITVLASYAVIVEIFRGATRYNPGIRRLTQGALLIVFGFTVAFAASNFGQGGFATLSRAIANLSRDLRYVEAGLLLVMLWLFVRYRVPFGRNRLGVMIGYSFWLAVNVVNLAFWFRPGSEFSVRLRGLLPATYVVTLAIWCVTLWSVQVEPVQPVATKLERDYGLLAARTQAMLARTFTRLVRIMRP